MKGCILSIEAINAIQTLKRAHKSFSTPDYSPILSRLLKADLLATLRELLRQDHCALALHAFSAVRFEYNNPDLSLYTDVATAHARNKMVEDLDRLIPTWRQIAVGVGSSVTTRGSSCWSRRWLVLIGWNRRSGFKKVFLF